MSHSLGSHLREVHRRRRGARVTASGTGVYAESGTGPALVLVNTGLAAPPSDAKERRLAAWVSDHDDEGGTLDLRRHRLAGDLAAADGPHHVGCLCADHPGARLRQPLHSARSRSRAAPIPVGGNRIISVAQGYKVNSDTPIPFTGVPAGVRAIAINLTATNVKARAGCRCSRATSRPSAPRASTGPPVSRSPTD